MTCLTEDELIAFADGELSENAAATVRVHLEECDACRARADSWRKLGGALAMPIAAEPGAEDRLEARLMAAPATARARRWTRAWIAGGILAAAAAAVLVVRSRPQDEGTFTARGGPVVHSLERDVGLSLYENSDMSTPLANGARVAPQSAFAVSYRNLGAPAFALVFAVDARHDVHWIAPAWIDAKSDPASIALSATSRDVTLPNATALDDVAPGALRVLVVVTQRPHRVSEIERMPAPVTANAIRTTWPDASVREIVLEERAP